MDRSHPNPEASKAIDKLDQAQSGILKQFMKNLSPTRESKPVGPLVEAAKPVISAPSPSPEELVVRSHEAKRQRQEKRIDAIARRQGRR
jgi:hypothetical protein